MGCVAVCAERIRAAPFEYLSLSFGSLSTPLRASASDVSIDKSIYILRKKNQKKATACRSELCPARCSKSAQVHSRAENWKETHTAVSESRLLRFDSDAMMCFESSRIIDQTSCPQLNHDFSNLIAMS
jgi:hypothetical protein